MGSRVVGSSRRRYWKKSQVIKKCWHWLIRGRLLAGPLVGPVPADQATGARSEPAVMPGIMAGDPADHRALETAGGLRRAAREAACRQDQCRNDYQRFHRILSCFAATRRLHPVSFNNDSRL